MSHQIMCAFYYVKLDRMFATSDQLKFVNNLFVVTNLGKVSTCFNLHRWELPMTLVLRIVVQVVSSKAMLRIFASLIKFYVI